MKVINKGAEKDSFIYMRSICCLEKQPQAPNISIQYSAQCQLAIALARHDVVAYAQRLNDEGMHVYVELVKSIKVFLLCYIRSCTAERSFFVLRGSYAIRPTVLQF